MTGRLWSRMRAAAAPTLVAGSAQVLQLWPRSGAWSTALIRTASNDLICYMASAPISSASGMIAGLRLKDEDLAIEIVARRAPQGTTNEIAVLIDGAAVGRFPITRRLHGFGYLTIVADVPGGAGDELLRQVADGRSIVFASGSELAKVSLAQSTRARASLQDCAVEQSRRRNRAPQIRG